MIKVGESYMYAYAWPGPDYTEVQVKAIKGNTVLCWDKSFKFEFETTKDQLIPKGRPSTPKHYGVENV